LHHLRSGATKRRNKVIAPYALLLNGRTQGRNAMSYRLWIGAAAIALAMCLPVTVTQAQDAKKYPAWDGLWKRGSPPGIWDPTKPPGLGQQAPLTAEYQAIHEANIAKAKAGFEFDPKSTCGPVGMPRVMTMYEPMEMVIKPQVTHMLIESQSPIRRIFTDGRDWPKNIYPSYVGYSIGQWLDTDGDGTYDTLEIETRNMKGPRLFDNTGIPLASDNETIVKEKIYLDKTDPNIMRNEITTIDHALTRPWTVSRFYRREHNPIWEEYNCVEDNRWVVIGGRMYMTDSDGYFMPIQKDQPPPELKYFQKYFNQTKK
jgi:hypothetical protein